MFKQKIKKIKKFPDNSFAQMATHCKDRSAPGVFHWKQTWRAVPCQNAWKETKAALPEAGLLVPTQGAVLAPVPPGPWGSGALDAREVLVPAQFNALQASESSSMHRGRAEHGEEERQTPLEL